MTTSTQKRRKNRELYFLEQDYTTRSYVVPYMQQFREISDNIRVLEIGCGEGGNMKYFVDAGCEVIGVDLNEGQLKRAGQFLEKHCENTENLQLIFSDIYKTDQEKLGKFDIIMMRDVIEHIPNQEKFMGFMQNFIKEDGICFFGFPPWQMPFGGHQQGCKSILKKIPYFHLLPNFAYKGLLQMFGEPESRISALMQTKSTGISIERFKRCVKQNDWKILDESLYLFNPNYDVKFKLKPKKQNILFRSIPYFRNFVTTCGYYIIAPNKSN